MEAAITSRPVIWIAPAVGSISRISVRTSVDLPDPDRPMTTNTSPGQTWSDTSRTAATQPVFSRSSPRGRSASGLPMIRSAFGPKTFQTPSARIRGSPRCSSSWLGRIGAHRGRRHAKQPGQRPTVPPGGGDDKRDTLSIP